MFYQKIMSFSLILYAILFSQTVLGVINGHLYTFEESSKTALFERLADELRCPKCQNQNLADSNSEVAEDLRRQLYEMVKDGHSESEIKDFMVDRYGNFVLYKPKVDETTWVLWYAPFVLLVIGLIVVMGIVLKQKKQFTAVNQSKTNSDSGSDSNRTLSDEERKRLDNLLHDQKSDERGD